MNFDERAIEKAARNVMVRTLAALVNELRAELLERTKAHENALAWLDLERLRNQGLQAVVCGSEIAYRHAWLETRKELLERAEAYDHLHQRHITSCANCIHASGGCPYTPDIMYGCEHWDDGDKP